MKYHVGEMFKLNTGVIVQITSTVVHSDSKYRNYYRVLIDGKQSNMMWYDEEFNLWQNITPPVIKALYE